MCDFSTPFILVVSGSDALCGRGVSNAGRRAASHSLRCRRLQRFLLRLEGGRRRFWLLEWRPQPRLLQRLHRRGREPRDRRYFLPPARPELQRGVYYLHRCHGSLSVLSPVCLCLSVEVNDSEIHVRKYMHSGGISTLLLRPSRASPSQWIPCRSTAG